MRWPITPQSSRAASTVITLLLFIAGCNRTAHVSQTRPVIEVNEVTIDPASKEAEQRAQTIASEAAKTTNHLWAGRYEDGVYGLSSSAFVITPARQFLY